MRNLFLFFLLSIAANTYAQMGCTDPQALNYDNTAMTNDGSCNYGLTEYSPAEVAILSDELIECSGVEFFDSGLWIHNDAGNGDKIYRIDSANGEILQSIIVATADNLDWEDITEDPEHIYIGDFGNNVGNRTDLRVFKINKSDLSSNVVNAELIEFSYSDQTDFSENNNNHDFDCEAFIFHNDSLHLFTKNWVDNETKHYILAATPGNHTATFVESFNTMGLVTGADISANGEIVLLGYTEIGVNFMWLLFDYSDGLFFSGNKRRVSLGTGLTNSQTEGITFRGDGNGFICSERFKVNDQVIFPQKLLSFSINDWVDNTTSITELDDSYQIKAHPNPFEDYLQVELSRTVDKWRLYSVEGRLIKSGLWADGQKQLELRTAQLHSGIYFFEIIKDNQSKLIQIVKR